MAWENQLQWRINNATSPDSPPETLQLFSSLFYTTDTLYYCSSYETFRFKNHATFYRIGYPISTRIWIGGTDIAQNENWMWSTGSLIKDQNYTNFDLSTPNQGDCLDIILPNDVTWKKSRCDGQDYPHGFIAEKGY